MKRTAWLALALSVAGLQAGCVTRRVMLTSDPPGAVVYRNGQPVGATPMEEPFIYYGRYQYRFVKDGYQPLDVMPDLVPPIYEYPGLDFISEALLPFTLRDLQKVHVKLVELEPVRLDDLQARARELQAQGQAIQRPADAPPPRSRNNTPPPAPPAVIVPPPATLPPPLAVPNSSNAPAPTPGNAPAPANAPAAPGTGVTTAKPPAAGKAPTPPSEDSLPTMGFTSAPPAAPTRREP